MRARRQKSTLKPEDPFNFSHFIGLHSHTSHVEDFIYMLNLDYWFLPEVFAIDSHILMIIEKYAMADLLNWTKV